MTNRSIINQPPRERERERERESKPNQYLSLILKSIIAGLLTAGIVYAWTNPTATPPGGGGALYYYNGNVGIGTTGPGAKLHVAGTAYITGANGIVDTSITAEPTFTVTGVLLKSLTSTPYIVAKTGTADTASAFVVYNSANTSILSARSDGNVGIATTAPSEKLEVNGNVKAAAFLYSSDYRLKTNIQSLPNQLEKVLELQGVSFNWKDDNNHNVGFIAQDVEKVFPEVVYTNKETGLKSVDYAKLTVFLVEALKEQQIEIEKLKASK